MVSKAFFSALVALLVAQQVLADPALCPDAEDAKILVYKQNVRVAAPEYGRVEKEYFIPKLHSTVNCITLSGDGAASASITAVGLAEDGSIKVKLVSGIQQGIDVVLDAYSAIVE